LYRRTEFAEKFFLVTAYLGSRGDEIFMRAKGTMSSSNVKKSMFFEHPVSVINWGVISRKGQFPRVERSSCHKLIDEEIHFMCKQHQCRWNVNAMHNGSAFCCCCIYKKLNPEAGIIVEKEDVLNGMEQFIYEFAIKSKDEQDCLIVAEIRLAEERKAEHLKHCNIMREMLMKNKKCDVSFWQCIAVPKRKIYFSRPILGSNELIDSEWPIYSSECDYFENDESRWPWLCEACSS